MDKKFNIHLNILCATLSIAENQHFLYGVKKAKQMSRANLFTPNFVFTHNKKYFFDEKTLYRHIEYQSLMNSHEISVYMLLSKLFNILNVV
jgi:hypothetical protein